MSTPTTERSRDALHTWAVVLSSLVIPLPILVGTVTEAVLDTSNPAGVDVSQGLAYLRELLLVGFGSLGVLLVAIVVLFTVLLRRERRIGAIALPLLVFVLQVVVGLVILVANGAVDAAERVPMV